MARRAGQTREENHANILASAGRGFRRKGFGGLGVDGLAKDAGVTSGAFYSHFASKADAFRAAVEAGMADLQHGVAELQETGGDAWLANFIDFYLTDRRICDLGDSCALQSLTSEVARADADARDTFEGALRRIINLVAAGLPLAEPAAHTRAIALLAILSGGVSLARAVSSPSMSEEIAAAVRMAATSIVSGEAIAPSAGKSAQVRNKKPAKR